MEQDIEKKDIENLKTAIRQNNTRELNNFINKYKLNDIIYHIDKQLLNTQFSGPYKYLYTLLMYFTVKNQDHLDIVNLLLDKGIRVERLSIEDKNFSIIDMIIDNYKTLGPNTEAIAFLLKEHGTKIDDFSLQMAIAKKKSPDMVLMLLKLGLNPNYTVPGFSVAPLKIAISIDSPIDIFKYLLEYGANANNPDLVNKPTARLNLQKFRLLVDYGFDINMVNEEGKTIYDLAKEEGNNLIVTYIDRLNQGFHIPIEQNEYSNTYQYSGYRSIDAIDIHDILESKQLFIYFEGITNNNRYILNVRKLVFNTIKYGYMEEKKNRQVIRGNISDVTDKKKIINYGDSELYIYINENIDQPTISKIIIKNQDSVNVLFNEDNPKLKDYKDYRVTITAYEEIN